MLSNTLVFVVFTFSTISCEAIVLRILLRYKFWRKNINKHFHTEPSNFWRKNINKRFHTEPSNFWHRILKIVLEKHFFSKIFSDQLTFSEIWSELSFSCTVMFFHTFIIRQYVKRSYLSCKIAPLPSNRDTHQYALLYFIPYVYAFRFHSPHNKNLIIALTVRLFPFGLTFRIDPCNPLLSKWLLPSTHHSIYLW